MWQKIRSKHKNIILRRSLILGLLILRIAYAYFSYSGKEQASLFYLDQPEQLYDAYVQSIVSHDAHSRSLILKLPRGVAVRCYVRESEQQRLTSAKSLYSLNPLLLLPGDKLQVRMHFSLPEPPRNPGNFDEPWYFFAQDLQLKGELLHSEQLAEGRSFRVLSLARRASFLLREALAERLIALMGESDGGLLAAMLFGSETYLGETEERLFRKAGLAHLLVVSGGNVALFMLFASFFAERLCGKLSLRALLLGLLLCAFGFLCDWDASVTRAVLTTLISLTAQALKRPTTPLRNLFYATLIVLFMRERYLLRLGFLMSVSCSAALIYFMPQMETYFEKHKAAMIKKHVFLRRWPMIMRLMTLVFMAASLSLCAQLAVLPFSSYLHSELGPAQILVNIPANLLASFSISLGFLTVLLLPLSFIKLSLLMPLAMPLQSVMKIFLALARWAAAAPFSFIATTSTLLCLAPFYIYVFYRLYRRKHLLSRTGRLKMLAISLLIWLAVLFVMRLNTPDFGLTFIDVGQGSAILLHIKGGGAILYDCGPASSAKQVASYCRSLGIKALDLVIISHMHEDHYGAFKDLHEELAIKAVVLPGDSKFTQVVKNEQALMKQREDLSDYCELQGIKKLSVKAGYTIRLGDLELYLIKTAAETGSLGNAGSAQIEACFRKESLLLLGDMPADQWQSLVKHMQAREALILQFPHHGASANLPLHGSLPMTKAVVMQQGVNNVYGHPHGSVLKFLQREAFPYFRTDEDGCTEIRAYGSRWDLQTFLSKKRLRLR